MIRSFCSVFEKRGAGRKTFKKSFPPRKKSFFLLSYTFGAGDAVFAQADEKREKGFGVEGNQRIEIGASAVDGLVGGEQKENPHTPHRKADKVKELNENQKQNSQKLERVPQLIAALREVGNRDKRHINDNLGNQPTYTHSEISQNQASYHRQRIG